MPTKVDPNKFKKHRGFTPPNRLFEHRFAGGRKEYTTGNEFIRVSIDNFNKSEPLEIVEFDIDPAELDVWKKEKPDRRPKLKLIKARIKGSRDRLTLDR